MTPSPSRSQPLDVRVYGLVLFLFPVRFREDFANDMQRDFADARHESLVLGRAELWRFRGRMACDLGRTLVTQWLRTGLPGFAAAAAIVPLIVVPVLANLWRQSQFVIPTHAQDSEGIGLSLLAVVAVLLVAETIVLTTRATRLMRRPPPRRR